MLEFIEKILTVLKDNGFPDKRVSLPTEKMYEAADNRGLSFNKVIEEMKKAIEIDVEITDEKIYFSAIKEQAKEEFKTNPFESFAGMNQSDLFSQAQEMLKNMDPNQIKQMQDMFMNMSDEEKEDIMKKGRDMGLI